MLLQIFLRNFYSNASCFSLVWLYLGNSQVSVDRTIGPTLVYKYKGMQCIDFSKVAKIYYIPIFVTNAVLQKHDNAVAH